MTSITVKELIALRDFSASSKIIPKENATEEGIFLMIKLAVKVIAKKSGIKKAEI